MTTLSMPAAPALSRARSVSSWLHRHTTARLLGLLSLPGLWILVAYLGSLAAMLVAAFWTTNDFTGAVEHTTTLANFQALLTQPVYRSIAGRSLEVAALVTIVDTVVALPMAYYMAKVASPRWRRLLVVAVLTPLWASYLVKAYAWRVMLAKGGVLEWLLAPVHGHGPGFGLTATIITLAYLWLPFMILPIFAGLERIPDSLLEASADLGGRGLMTFRRVILPISIPAVVAGSIFTFSLTLGDYIVPGLVSTTQFIGNVIFINVAQDLPLAAAYSLVPLVIMLAYLVVARRLGAFEAF